jgi:hypothetical protein
MLCWPEPPLTAHRSPLTTYRSLLSPEARVLESVPHRRLDFIPQPDNRAPMSVAELQKTIRGLSAADRQALATIATRMKQRNSTARRRKLTVAMRAMDAGKKFTWDEVKQTRAERRKASDG